MLELLVNLTVAGSVILFLSVVVAATVMAVRAERELPTSIVQREAEVVEHQADLNFRPHPVMFSPAGSLFG